MNQRITNLKWPPHNPAAAACSPDGKDSVQIWNELFQLPCAQPDLEMHMPLLELDPWQVVDLGYQVNAPFDRTWSCVEETADPVADRCDIDG